MSPGTKKQETKKTIKIADIVTAPRDRFTWIFIPHQPVEIDIAVTGSAAFPPTKMDRLLLAAKTVVLENAKIIVEECLKLDKKIQLEADKPFSSPAEFQKNLAKVKMMMAEANAAMLAAMKGTAAAAEDAVEAALKKEKQGDKLLTEARVKTVLKLTFGAVTVTAALARLGVSMGAEVTAYKSLASGLLQIGKELYQLSKDAKKAEGELIAGIKAYLELRSTALMKFAQKGKIAPPTGTFIQKLLTVTQHLTASGPSGSKKVKDVTEFIVQAVKADWNNVEKARVLYRDRLTAVRHDVDGMSTQCEKLMQAMKRAVDFKEGIRIGAACMKLKGQLRLLVSELQKSTEFLESAQHMMEQFGLEVDDRTFLEKLKSLDADTILETAKAITENLEFIADLFG